MTAVLLGGWDPPDEVSQHHNSAGAQGASWGTGASDPGQMHSLVDHDGGRVGEQTVREFGMDMYTLLYLGWITNKDLLYSIAQGTLLNII